MKGYRLRFTPEAALCISSLHPESKKIIRASLDLLRENPFSGDDLRGELTGFKSCKPKRFRIIYSLENERRVIRVYYVGHRRDVYEQFRRLLAKLSEKRSDGPN